jgi:hypothetical protein
MGWQGKLTVTLIISAIVMTGAYFIMDSVRSNRTERAAAAKLAEEKSAAVEKLVPKKIGDRQFWCWRADTQENFDHKNWLMLKAPVLENWVIDHVAVDRQQVWLFYAQTMPESAPCLPNK